MRAHVALLLLVSANSSPLTLLAICRKFTYAGQTNSCCSTLTFIQARIRDPNAATRATVLSAIRYTFVVSSPAFDEVLAPYILDFLSLMEDAELVINVALLVGSNSHLIF